MPVYCYKCSICDSEVEVRHGMTERLEDCEACDNKQVLTRIPQLTNFVRKESKDSQQTGDLVKEYIEENKRILKDEKATRIKHNE